MPNLVGIGNSQVPTNAMLGGLAYQDPAHANLTEVEIENIAAIKAKIDDTASAGNDDCSSIFVYDTRKDSDGGAWRKRTSHTSWYNEGANVYRGARKEFPAVAIIVAASTPGYQVTIYDGDDPNLSMWMKWWKPTTQDPFLDYTDGGSSHLGNYEPFSVRALNGIICVGTVRTAGSLSNLNAGLREFHLIEDACYATNNDKRVKFPTGIVDRNFSLINYVEVSSGSLVSANVRGVAMTVLPNAPINDVTGLPIPTIAVATDGGTNVIKDNGIIQQGYTTSASRNIDIHSSGYMIDGITGASNDNFSLYHISDTTRKTFYDNRESTGAYDTFLNEGKGNCLFEGSGNKLAMAQTLGLLRIEEEFSDYASGLHNRTTSSYNTGWMFGDIRAAYLMSTVTGISTSGNIFSNGTFDSNIDGWHNWDASRGAVTHNSGRMRFNNSGSGDVYAYGEFDHTVPYGATITVSGDYYTVSGDSATMVQIYPYNDDQGSFPDSGGLGTFAGTNGAGATDTVFTATGDGFFSITTTVGSPSGATGVLIGLDPNGAGPIFELDNLVCTYTYGRLTDHSINSKDLVVFGSGVTKTPVATGADLMGFSGFSDTSYILGGTNPNFNFGSGDWYFTFWVNPNDAETGDVIMSYWSYNQNTTTDARIGIYFNSGSVRFDLTDEGASSYQAFTGNNRIQDSSKWHLVHVIRRGTHAELWVNGVRDVRTLLNSTADGDYTNIRSVLEIGKSANMGTADSGIELALIRIGKGSPSQEQIEKMYDDEKQLFEENAKCTLYGTSDDVKALAYDDSTDTLHVGTDEGRSDFVGLRRINNTTSLTNTAISASNGIIAEQ